MVQQPRKKAVSTTSLTGYFLVTWMLTKSSFLEAFTSSKVLVKFRTGKINMCGNLRLFIHTEHQLVITSTTSKSTETLGCTQDPNICNISTALSRDSVIFHAFWTQEQWEEPTTVLTIVTRKYDSLIHSPGNGGRRCDSLAVSWLK